jgi:3-keto-5-aminohexanoate cleavage enzyme
MSNVKPWAPPPLGGWEPMIINVALTGAVPTRENNPAVPLTPEEIAADAVACARAGASIVHVHVRDEAGRPSHRRDLYERAIGPIREQVPDLIVCVTTSGRVDPDVEARMNGLDLDPPPDMASLTLGSFNFRDSLSPNPPQVIEALLRRCQERGVRPELEVFELGMVNTAHMLMERGLIGEPSYVNILLGSPGAAPAFVGHLAAIVDRLPPGAVWAGAGIGVFQRPIVAAAAAMGGNVRTGLEDAPRSIDGQPSTNVAAVEHAVRAAELVGRRVATPPETRARLGLPARVPA